jgi:membrane protease subunit HflK
MAWNEPGGGKDPWSGKGGDQGPPDLDEVVRKLQERLGGLFGGRRRGGGGGNGSGRPYRPVGGVSVGVVLGLALVGWLASGIYIVQPAERGVVTRFGAYEAVTSPGPHWHLPFPIEGVQKVDVDEIKSFRHQAQMLTRDENIVDVALTVQSRVQDPTDFLFQVQNPEQTLRDATETAVRETIGKNQLDFILTEGRSTIGVDIKARIQELLNNYRTGLIVTSVNTQPARPPDAVKSAFDDAIKAREDKARLENQAEAYANDVLPRARGAAARRVADAEAYRDKVVADAQGETARFNSVLAQFQKAPAVTRERLYIDAIQSVLSKSPKVMLDVPGGTNLTYLPLDKLIQPPRPKAQSRDSAEAAASAAAPSRPVEPEPTRAVREPTRERRMR